MDKSSKAVDEALKTLRELETAYAASEWPSDEHYRLLFAVRDAKRVYRAALMAEPAPRVNCARCERQLKPGEPVIWRWLYGQSTPQCLRCHRAEHKSKHADRLASLKTYSCETCARTMYLDGFYFRHPLTCSYQCGYRRKLKRELERQRVEHETVACIVCGEMFNQRRRDAQTCGNACRQKLFRRNHASA